MRTRTMCVTLGAAAELRPPSLPGAAPPFAFLPAGAATTEQPTPKQASTKQAHHEQE
ncbi:hypothetical protein [Streptomyces lancefieldiae]|uniref:Uncharacterized protein n=1 Tax=Streptomyces lancefieldiae TaxID=3075520 RepID=A0ABU3AJJ7_9ACTN|nr:hypothetical protein [Streptomyces sp. DSM 40712]MDT0610113.1 hypothetical protein [Streptomyces sp. DSM 40712]